MSLAAAWGRTASAKSRSRPGEAYLAALNRKGGGIEEVSGNRDFTQGGTAGGVTAASAIAALQEAGSKLSRDMLKGQLRRFLPHDAAGDRAHPPVLPPAPLFPHFGGKRRCRLYRLFGQHVAGAAAQGGGGSRAEGRREIGARAPFSTSRCAPRSTAPLPASRRTSWPRSFTRWAFDPARASRRWPAWK